MDSARLDELEQLRAKAIQEKQSPGYSMDAQAAYIAALVLSAPDLIAYIREQEAKLDHMKRKHDTAIELYTEYHDVNGALRNDLYSMEKAIEKLSNIAAKLCYNYGNNDCSSCPFGATPCKSITAKDWKEAALSEAFILGRNAATEAMAHANQTWLTWQKGYPTEPGLYRLKYEDGTVRVDELCFRVMNQTRRYLGFANEFAHPIEDDANLIAWAGPIPEPGE